MSNNYEAKLDSKKRLTIRSPRTEYYHVTEKSDGTVILKPRVLIHPDEISKRSLEMMDKAVKHLKDGKASDYVDLKELDELLKSE